MVLHEFLAARRGEVLELAKARIAQRTTKAPDPEILDSLPAVYDNFVALLRADAAAPRTSDPAAAADTAAAHGLRRLRLGFTLDEIVHDYGELCNAITDVSDREHAITPREFQLLNQVLDAAIARSVTEYAAVRERERERETTEHLGFLAHELRNTLHAARLSLDTIRRGQVAIAGKTGDVLERSLVRLQTLVDRTMAEVRIRSGAELVPERASLRDLIDEVQTSTAPDARAHGSVVVVGEVPAVETFVDRPLVVSAIANLVQNGIKSSPRHSEIYVRCATSDGLVVIEVADECGGLSEDKLANLWRPFVRERPESRGLGLGLAITRKAVEAHRGRIYVRNMPGKGCTFVVELPAAPKRGV